MLINKGLDLLYKFITAPRWESMRQVENKSSSVTTENNGKQLPTHDRRRQL
jgi:hypothetical protein